MINETQKINDYVAGRLTGRALETFELELLSDIPLQEAVQELQDFTSVVHSANQAESSPAKVPAVPITPVKVVYIESMRRANPKPTIIPVEGSGKSNSTLVSIELGPTTCVDYDVNIRNSKAEVVYQEHATSDTEAYLDLLMPNLDADSYSIEVKGPDGSRNFQVDIVNKQ